MVRYRIFVLGNDGRYLRVETVEVDEDHSALKHAQQVVNGHDVEIWKFGRCIARLPGDREKPPL
jgi:hypothetical protein